MKLVFVILVLQFSVKAFGAGLRTIRGLKTDKAVLDLPLKYRALLATNRCGSSWGDALSSCGQECPGGVDSECPSGQSCFSDVTCEGVSTGDNTSSGSNRCGSSWENAMSSCGQECPGGVDSECPSGQSCFSDVTCEGVSTGDISSSGSNRCGSSWENAMSSCGQKCPGGVDSECPSGLSCFSDVTCDDVSTGDNSSSGSNRCGSSWENAMSSCGQECPGGCDSECPSGQSCFSDVTCEDVSTGNNGENSSANDSGSHEWTTPLFGCEGNGGNCICGKGGDGNLITLNRFYGDDSDEKVWGCGGAFILSGIDLEAQYDGEVPSVGGNVAFTQESSWEGWEGCCAICGYNLEWSGKISSGWYCEKDFFATGIWL